MALALPKLRWLVLGAIAVGAWVVYEDMKGPRPSERVPSWLERGLAAKPQSQKPPADSSRPAKLAVAKPSPARAPERPVPPDPVASKPAPQKAVPVTNERQNPVPQKKTLQKPAQSALLLPKAVDRPPAKPQKIITGSITRPDKPSYVQTKSKVFMRAQAKADAPIIATLGPRTVMRELARSGEWRLLMGDGRKGWVRADHLSKPSFLPRRPKLPVAEAGQATRTAAP